MDLDLDLVGLLRKRAICNIATTLPDGSPQLTQTWVDTDGTRRVINTGQGFQTLPNIERGPRVAVTVADPDDPSVYYAIRERVVTMTTDATILTQASSYLLCW